MYSSRLGRNAVAGLAAAVCLVALCGTARAEAVKCKSAILKASAAFVQAKAKALQKCEDTVVKGKLPQSTDCSGELKASGAIAKAAGKLTGAIDKACGGADKLCGGDATGEDGGSAIGFPATCPNFESGGCTNAVGTADCTGIATCLHCIGEAAVDQAIGLSYDNLVTTDPKAQKLLNKCQAAIGKAAVAFFAAKSKALSKCWDAVNKGKGNAPCPAPGDGKASGAIAAATAKLSTAILKACAGKDKAIGGTDVNADFTPGDIGFPAHCSDVDPPGTSGPCGGPVNDLQGLIACVTCVNEFKVDCSDRIGAATLAAYPSQCNPGPTVTATPTTTPPPSVTPSPSPTNTPGPQITATPNCGDGVVSATEFCDPAAPGAGACGAAFTCNAVTCNCACPSTVHFTSDAADPATILDSGWTGISHRAPVISNGDVTVSLSGCAGTTRPCGQCNITGPIPNTGVNQLDSRRCTNDTSIKCTTNTPCTGGGGTCEFFFGSNLPLAAGGVSVCVTNQFAIPIVGTANVETGTSANTVKLTSRVYNGISVDSPCPRCIGDTTINDGVAGGTCNGPGSPRHGLACDANGSVPGRPDFGITSLDCPPNGPSIANLPIDLTNSTGTVTKTLSALSPNCGDTSGAAGEKCLCDTCNNINAEPCGAAADCPDPPGPVGPVCGGKRCLGGSNNGATCNNDTVCPGGGLCNRPGAGTRPSACIDDTSTPGILDCVDTAPVDGEGKCSKGPVTQACSVASGHAQRACAVDADCGGGAGSCTSTNRLCFLTGGFSGKNGTNTLIAEGMADPPVADTSHPTLGAVFCIGPVGADAVNTVSGLPGPGRVTIKGDAEGLP